MSIFTTLVLVLCWSAVATAQRKDKITTCQRVLNPPPNTKCGVKGTVSTPKILADGVGHTTANLLFEDCRDRCLDEGNSCKSFFINPQTLRCRTFSATIESMGFKANNAAGNPTFYSKDCIESLCYTTTKTTLTSDAAADDTSYRVCPPVPLTFYNSTYPCVDMGSNGVLSFSGATTSYTNQALPTSDQLPSRAIAVFWDDLTVEDASQRRFPDQELSWTYGPLSANRVITFEWKTRVYDAGPFSWAHFTLTFLEGDNAVRATYVHLANTFGEGATVGMQDLYKGKSLQVSYNTPSISSGDEIVFSMRDNTFVKY